MIIRLAGMSVRQGCLLGLLMCALMMGVALVLQYVYGLTPCPLCIGQRIAVLLAAFVFAIARRRAGRAVLKRSLLMPLDAVRDLVERVAVAAAHHAHSKFALPRIHRISPF